jgi:riboflavin kinase/FMN adenylyltransferase
MRVLEWEAFTTPQSPLPVPQLPLSITIGVFDGVHRGHKALLDRIVSEEGALSTVITFKQNPLRVLRPQNYAGDIFSLAQKLETMEALGVGQVVLIDFSENFSKINGRDFVDLLLKSRPVRFLALGPNFRCGYRMDTGVREIKALAGGIETWTADPVMEGREPVSSSRIRQAIGEGEIAEAAKLLGRPVAIDVTGMPVTVSCSPKGRLRSYGAAEVCRITPPGGAYRALVYGDSAAGTETVISIENGRVLVPDTPDKGVTCNPRRIVLLHRTQ